MKQQEITIRLPVDERQILFETMQLAKGNSYSGPWRFIDVAGMIAGLLLGAGENLEQALPHRIMRDLRALAWVEEEKKRQETNENVGGLRQGNGPFESIRYKPYC